MFLLFMSLDGAQPRTQKKNYTLLENLILEISNNNIAALEELYKQTDTSVYGFALSILKNPHEAEDVMHDAYVKIYESAETYQPMGKPMAWILTIVRNLALSRFRSKDKSNLVLEEDFSVSNSYDFTESSMDQLIINKILKILSDEERQIVILHSITGLKHKEISELLRIPLSTVLSKYHRSLAKLRKLLKEEAK